MAEKKRKKGRADPASLAEAGGFDMTPMIDVTFLLIIFFMIVTDISNRAKPSLKLARAEQAVEDIMDDPRRLIINIMRDGEIRVGAQAVSEAELRAKLQRVAAISMAGGLEFPNRRVMIRADKESEFGGVQKVMAMCMDQRLWRISFQTENLPN